VAHSTQGESNDLHTDCNSIRAQLHSLYQIPAQLYPFLQLPNQALLNLQTFLTHGDYSPKIASRLLSKLDGPPRIHIGDKNNIKQSSPTNPLHDLRTYLLAQQTSLQPLRHLVLLRLYSQRLLEKEINAISFLEEIYTGTPSTNTNASGPTKSYTPDADLRRFAQSFLCAPHPDLPTKAPGLITLQYEDTIFGRRVTSETDTEPTNGMDNSNLHILQTNDKYSGRLAKLRGTGGLFLEDLDIVTAALGKMEPITMPKDLVEMAARSGVAVALEAANVKGDKDIDADADMEAGLAGRVLGNREVLDRLEATAAAAEERRAFARYQEYVRRRGRPLLGLGGGLAPPWTVGELVDEARLEEEMERLGALRI
jgi:hypothetical protein